jgi:hypothetical protein
MSILSETTVDLAVSDLQFISSVREEADEIALAKMELAVESEAIDALIECGDCDGKYECDDDECCDDECDYEDYDEDDIDIDDFDEDDYDSYELDDDDEDIDLNDLDLDDLEGDYDEYN